MPLQQRSHLSHSDWLGMDWGTRGGLKARQLALWLQLQREFWHRGLLSPDACRRLEALGVVWEPQVKHLQAVRRLPCMQTHCIAAAGSNPHSPAACRALHQLTDAGCGSWAWCCT